MLKLRCLLRNSRSRFLLIDCPKGSRKRPLLYAGNRTLKRSGRYGIILAAIPYEKARRRVPEMKVILLADVYKQGVAGEMVEVAPGYARNYLVPRKLAVQATR